MRTLPIHILEQLAGGPRHHLGIMGVDYQEDVRANYLVYLIVIETNPPLRLTNADIDIWFEGFLYSAHGMDFGAAEYSITPAADKVFMELDNTGFVWSSIIQTQEIRGRRCIIRLAMLDDRGRVLGTVVHFDGLVDSMRLTNKTLKMDIFNHMILWKKRLPRRTHQATCTWTYKDPATCKYSGMADLCDKSWESCGNRANLPNFGGFRYLPSLENKQLWWGRQPK